MLEDIYNKLMNIEEERLKDFLKFMKDFVDSKIKSFLPSKDSVPLLPESMEYTIMAGGKRIRPILAIVSFVLSGGREEEYIVPISVGFEMLHTYTLVHDDLPAMDNDDYRRGKLTCHKVYGEDIAILTGDALFSQSYESFLMSKAPHDRIVHFLKEVSRAIGVLGVVGGQVMDVYKEKPKNPKYLRTLHFRKTASFISLCTKTGPIIAGNRSLEASMEKIGAYMGMLFQITDDILDEVGTLDQLGKSPGKDKEEDKLTYVTLYGLEGAVRRADGYLRHIYKLVDKLGNEFKFFKLLANYIRHRKK